MCIYSNYTNDSELLCSLWCSIQVFDDRECIHCPEEYKSHVENETLCDLHTQLELLQQELGVPNNDTTNNTLVPCNYENSESKDILCELWCAVQTYHNKSCISCPNEYAALANNQTICDLHQELVLLQQHGNSSVDTSNFSLVDCNYKNEQNEDILCNLWCEIQLYNNSKCIECPDDYKNHEENVTLCDLNTELQLLQQTYGTVPEASLDKQPVMCIYEKNIHKQILCNLWCDIQLFSDHRCIDCPENYANEPESELLCMLNEQLEISKYPNNIQLTTSPSGGLEPVSCPYKDYTSSSVELCQVWCKLQELSGILLNTFF